MAVGSSKPGCRASAGDRGHVAIAIDRSGWKLSCVVAVAARATSLTLFANAIVTLFQLFEFFVAEFFHFDQLIVRVLGAVNELVQLKMDGLGVSVLRVLNKK